MRLDSLKHLVRSVTATMRDEKVVVCGAASLLPGFPEQGEDSAEHNIGFCDADLVVTPFSMGTGNLLVNMFGESSAFHTHFGYYADIVRPGISELFPKGWDDRLIPLPGVERVFCIEAHDMAAGKCQAGRPKDVELLALLISTGRLDPKLVTERLFAVAMREAMIATSHRILDDAVKLAAKAVEPD